eukprot:1306458-Pyramimonas_sp.AAC.1
MSVYRPGRPGPPSPTAAAAPPGPRHLNSCRGSRQGLWVWRAIFQHSGRSGCLVPGPSKTAGDEKPVPGKGSRPLRVD